MRAIMFILAVLLLSSTAYAVEERVFQGAYPKAYLYSQSPDPVQPGNYVELRVKVDNNGVDTLKNFQIEIMPEYPFALDANEIALKEYGDIGSSQYGDSGVIVKWKLRVNAEAVEGSNKARIRYRFGTDAWVYKDLQVSIKTKDAALNIKNIITLPETIAPGEKFDLVIEAENEADSFLKSIKFRLDIPAPFAALGTSDEKFIRTLEPGESKNATFSLISKGNADATVYTIPLKVTYYDNEEDSYSKNLSFGIVLLEEPQLIKNIEDTKVFSSGDKGAVTISISNSGVDEVKFVKATLKDGDDYRVVSTREAYLGNIGSDDFESAKYDIYVKTNKESIPLSLMLTYKDNLNRKHSEDVILRLPIYSSGEARRLGLKPQSNYFTGYLSLVVFVFAFIFWLYMLLDLLPRKMARYKKLSWLAILIITTLFGAAAYYFMIKRKQIHNA